MEIYYDPLFKRQYRKLPIPLQKLAKEKEKLFRINPFDPRLKTHKLFGELKDFWSFSISYSHRIIFRFADNDTVWFYQTGTHDIYD